MPGGCTSTTPRQSKSQLGSTWRQETVSMMAAAQKRLLLSCKSASTVSIFDPYSIHIHAMYLKRGLFETVWSGHRKWMKMGYERRCHYRSIWRCCFFEVFLIVIWTPRGVANVLYLLHLHGLFFPLVFGPLYFDVNLPKFGLLPVARCYPLVNHFFHPLCWILTSPNSSPETLQKQKAVRIQDCRTSSDCQEDCACRKGSCTNNTTDIHCTGDP